VTASTGCPNFCLGRGVCEDGSCKCTSPFDGDDCSAIVPEKELCPKNCMDRGTCSGGKCKCLSEFAGPDCGRLTVCPSNCSAQGSCVEGRCKCFDGFAGEACAQVCPSAGVGVGCAGNGKCAIQDGKATCFCSSGFSGSACELDSLDVKEADGDLGKPIGGGGSPLALILACLVGALVVLMLGGYAYNYSKGDRGMAAVPGYSLVKGKTKTDDDSSYSRVK